MNKQQRTRMSEAERLELFTPSERYPLTYLLPLTI